MKANEQLLQYEIINIAHFFPVLTICFVYAVALALYDSFFLHHLPVHRFPPDGW